MTGRLLRALVSAVLLGYLLWRADLRAIGATVRAADAGWLALAFLLHVPGYLLSAARWQLLLRTQRFHVPLPVLLRSYLVGSFFNQLLPTTVGGDVVRVWDTARYTGATEAAFLAVLIERLTGILALAILALLGLGVSLGRVGGVGLTALVAVMIGLTLVPLWLVWSPRLLAPVLGWVRRRGGARVGGLVDRGEQALALFGKARGSLLGAMALAFLLQITVVAHFYLIAQALGLSLPLGYLFLVVPVTTFVLMLPVSINGIGVREGVYALFFTEFGVPVAGAIAFAWLGFGMALAYAAVGGVLYALRK